MMNINRLKQATLRRGRRNRMFDINRPTLSEAKKEFEPEPEYMDDLDREALKSDYKGMDDLDREALGI